MEEITVEKLTDPKFFERLKERFFDYLPKVGVMVLIVAAGLVLTFLINRIAKKAMARMRIDPSLAAFLRRVLRIVCYVLIVFMALSELGVATTGLVAFFSAALAAVALALKDSLSDITSGVILLFTRPFVTGDHIEFDGCRGTVLKIDIVHTNILTYDDTNIIIPNSRITSSEIVNYTAHPESRVTIAVPVSYTQDIDRVKAVLLATMAANELVLKEDPYLPRVQLERFADSSLEFSARCWTNFKNYWTVYYGLTEQIKKDLDRAGVEIPFNQLDVHVSLPPARNTE